MNKLHKSIKWSVFLLIAALTLQGCQKTVTARETEPPASESLIPPAAEAEENLLLLEEGKSYSRDLDGDGTAESIRYLIIDDNDYSRPQIYINDQLLFDDQEAYGYALEIYLTDISKEDKYQEICVYTTVESETVQTASILRYQDNELKLLDNLAGQDILGGAGVYYRGGIDEIKGDGIIVISADTPVYGNMFGSYYISVFFVLEGDTLRESPQDYYTCFNSKTGYVVSSGFTAATKPGGSETAFTGVPGEVVDFDGICIFDGQFYGRVTNSDGISGWLIDQEELFPGEEGAYFEEVMSWG